jgi:hypothetical protein
MAISIVIANDVTHCIFKAIMIQVLYLCSKQLNLSEIFLANNKQLLRHFHLRLLCKNVLDSHRRNILMLMKILDQCYIDVKQKHYYL